MSDPQTTNVGLYIPTRGGNVGVWDLPENANDSATDSLFANVATISLTNANVTLTTPPNTGSSWAGPYQSQSGILKFTGTLTGNCTITIPRAGFFIVDNQCTVGAFYVRLGSSAPGSYICAPPGAPTQIYCDGVNVRYVNLGAVGAALDLQGATAIPAWISNCTTPPYLLKDGTVYNYSDYPALGRQLGSTFGGNGITTFGVPDERNRIRIPIDTTVAAAYSLRLTTAICGIDGKTMNAAGGDQSMSAHVHNNSATAQYGLGALGVTAAGTGVGTGTSFGPDASLTVTMNNASYGAGGSQNVQPAIVSFLPLIKT